MRLLYFSAGWFFFVVGIIGVILPVLPTTPFMLLALWCFSKSSQRFHAWLYQHRFFGPALQQWEQDKVIPLPAKIMATLMMVASFSYLVFYQKLQLEILIPIGLFMLYGLWFIHTKPSKPRN